MFNIKLYHNKREVWMIKYFNQQQYSNFNVFVN